MWSYNRKQIYAIKLAYNSMQVICRRRTETFITYFGKLKLSFTQYLLLVFYKWLLGII